MNQKHIVTNTVCILFLVEPAYLVVLCEEELVVIDLLTKDTGYVRLVTQKLLFKWSHLTDLSWTL